MTVFTCFLLSIKLNNEQKQNVYIFLTFRSPRAPFSISIRKTLHHLWPYQATRMCYRLQTRYNRNRWNRNSNQFQTRPPYSVWPLRRQRPLLPSTSVLSSFEIGDWKTGLPYRVLELVSTVVHCVRACSQCFACLCVCIYCFRSLSKHSFASTLKS